MNEEKFGGKRGAEGREIFRQRLQQTLLICWRFGYTDPFVMARLWNIRLDHSRTVLRRMAQRGFLDKLTGINLPFSYYMPTRKAVQYIENAVPDDIRHYPPIHAQSKAFGSPIHDLMCIHFAMDIRQFMEDWDIMNEPQNISMWGPKLTEQKGIHYGGPTGRHGVRPDVLVVVDDQAGDRYVIAGEMQRSSQGSLAVERRLSVYGQAIMQGEVEHLFIGGRDEKVLRAYALPDEGLPEWFHSKNAAGNGAWMKTPGKMMELDSETFADNLDYINLDYLKKRYLIERSAPGKQPGFF